MAAVVEVVTSLAERKIDRVWWQNTAGDAITDNTVIRARPMGVSRITMRKELLQCEPLESANAATSQSNGAVVEQVPVQRARLVPLNLLRPGSFVERYALIEVKEDFEGFSAWYAAVVTGFMKQDLIVRFLWDGFEATVEKDRVRYPSNEACFPNGRHFRKCFPKVVAVGGAHDEELLAEEEETGTEERNGGEETEANSEKAAAKERKKSAAPKGSGDASGKMRKAMDVMMRGLIVQIQGMEENFRARRETYEKELYLIRSERANRELEREKVERVFQHLVKECTHLNLVEKELVGRDHVEHRGHDKMLCLLKKQYLFYAREASSAFGRAKSNNAALELDLACCKCHKKPFLAVDGRLVNEECVLACGHFFCLSCLPPPDGPCSACPPPLNLPPVSEPVSEGVNLPSVPPGIPQVHSFMPPFFPGQNAHPHQIYFPLHFYGNNQFPLAHPPPQQQQQMGQIQEFPRDAQQE